jgi:hypothetical protein
MSSTWEKIIVRAAAEERERGRARMEKFNIVTCLVEINDKKC